MEENDLIQGVVCKHCGSKIIGKTDKGIVVGHNRWCPLFQGE